MQVFELTLKVFLLKDIKSEDSLIRIAQLIDKSLVKDEEFVQLHMQNKYKPYNFNSLYPLEKDKVYRSGRIYSVIIRTIDEKIMKYFKENLTNEYTDHIKSLTIETRVVPNRYIEKIYSITPAVIKTEVGYWKRKLSLDEYQNRIKVNLIKKYNDYFNIKIDENFKFFKLIKIENIKPISCKYKQVKILGDKLTLMIDENEMAQKLAYLALGLGIGEMNARGYGFVNFQWI